MAAAGLPEAFRPLRGYVKLASDHEQRDPVVAYYTKMYLLQRGMEIDRKSPDCRQFLAATMDELEQIKQSHHDNEAIMQEVVGQAHMENAALKLFSFGDTEDRASHFSIKLVKVFHSCSLLIDVLKNFGELTDDLVKCQKYAKWKAAYIHTCLQTGQTPIPGPLTDEGDEEATPQPPDMAGYGQAPPSQPQQPSQPSPYPQHQQPTPGGAYANQNCLPTPGAHAPPTTPAESPPGGAVQQPTPMVRPAPWQPPANPTGVSLTPAQYQLAMKWCKYAGSALQYQDSTTAIDNLTKALKLLTTGQEH